MPSLSVNLRIKVIETVSKTWKWKQSCSSMGVSLENVFGGSNRIVQLLIYPFLWPSSPIMKTCPFPLSSCFGTGAPAVLREKGNPV